MIGFELSQCFMKQYMLHDDQNDDSRLYEIGFSLERRHYKYALKSFVISP